MIRNQREYEEAIREHTAAKDRLARLRASLEQQGYDESTIADLMDSELAFAAQLIDEISAYERVCKRQFETVPLQGLGRLLINLRIANGLKQRDLAARLSVDPSIVSRDERNEYRGLTLDRAEKIIEALEEHVFLTVSPRPAQHWSRTFAEFNQHVLAGASSATLDELAVSTTAIATRPSQSPAARVDPSTVNVQNSRPVMAPQANDWSNKVVAA